MVLNGKPVVLWSIYALICMCRIYTYAQGLQKQLGKMAVKMAMNIMLQLQRVRATLNFRVVWRVLERGVLHEKAVTAPLLRQIYENHTKPAVKVFMPNIPRL